MKNLNNYITEKLRINKNTKVKGYTCHPKTRKELKLIIEDRLEKDKNANLNDIDVSNITDMKELFVNLDPHNIDISEWDVSNVKDMYWMFYLCIDFNSDLSEWDVSNVEDMADMFSGCEKLNCDLDKWNTSKVENMAGMFDDCDSLEKIPKWFKV